MILSTDDVKLLVNAVAEASSNHIFRREQRATLTDLRRRLRGYLGYSTPPHCHELTGERRTVVINAAEMSRDEVANLLNRLTEANTR